MSDASDGRPSRGSLEDNVEEMASATRVLVVWETGSATYLLRPGEQVTVGRHSECEVLVTLPSVSRRHARMTGSPRLAPNGELATIEDVGGMNGVRVRGQKIPVNQPVPVGVGDVIELGGAIVVLHPPRDHGAPSAGAIARATAYRSSGGEDPMKAVDRLIDVVAQSDLAVLLMGETGVGKSHAAESIHSRSARARGPLRMMSCGATSADRLEAELFGYERNAFPGATHTKPGALEASLGGTVLLEDIDEMPMSTQAKLLSAIETREAVRAGATRPYTFDVRFIASTSRDLLALTRDGSFDLALYYRLNGISIVIPPLRERAGEILRFATRFLNEAAKQANKPPPRLSNEAIGMIVRHPFYGNIRELKSSMERACILAAGSFIGPEHLFFESIPPGAPQKSGSTSVSVPVIPVASPAMRTFGGRFPAIAPTEPPDAMPGGDEVFVPAPPRAPFLSGTQPDPRKAPTAPAPPPSSHPSGGPPPSASTGGLRDQMTAYERDRIVAALDQCRGNQTRAAEMLGMSRRALIARIEQYGLPRPRKR